MKADAASRCLGLVGMSGAGKSFWARRLEERGWRRHDCDHGIAAELVQLVQPGPAEEPVHALGRWMGMPWSAGYAGREARYLALEERVTRRYLERTREGAGPQVLDTTGSVIYLPAPLVAELRASCRVVYLRTPESRYDDMLRLYLHEPKPVVWGGAFGVEPGEALEAALPRCYRELLRTRDRRYLALAHAVIDAEALAERGDPLSILERL